MQHATYTSVNHGNSRLVVIRSQIGSLTINLSFGHNLCFKYSNGSCEPILDIYVSKAFQWHNERFNPMNFNPWNLPLKIRESIETSTSKVGAHLRVCGFNPSHFPTLPWTWSVTFGLHSLPTTLQSLALVTSSRLWLRHKVNYAQTFRFKANVACIINPWVHWGWLKNPSGISNWRSPRMFLGLCLKFWEDSEILNTCLR